MLSYSPLFLNSLTPSLPPSHSPSPPLSPSQLAAKRTSVQTVYLQQTWFQWEGGQGLEPCRSSGGRKEGIGKWCVWSRHRMRIWWRNCWNNLWGPDSGLWYKQAKMMPFPRARLQTLTLSTKSIKTICLVWLTPCKALGRLFTQCKLRERERGVWIHPIFLLTIVVWAVFFSWFASQRTQSLIWHISNMTTPPNLSTLQAVMYIAWAAM